MKRNKLVTGALMAMAMCMALALAGCSGQQQQQQESAEPLNLDGTYTQVDKGDAYMQAVIDGDAIEVDWVSDGGSTRSLYWAGTVDRPTQHAEQYAWTSKNDVSKTQSALLASPDESKDFSYDSGKLSYSASAMGTTKTMVLEKE